MFVSQREVTFLEDLIESEHEIPDYNKMNFFTKNMRAPQCKALSTDQVDFTLVTQTSLTRLGMLDEHCRRWGPHPISIAVGAPKLNERKLLEHLQALPSCDLDLVSVSLVTDYENGLDYPVNRLRNMALSTVATSHAIYIDMDFVLSDGVYDQLMMHRNALLDTKTAVILPAFDLIPHCKLSMINSNETCAEANWHALPRTKEEAFKAFVPPEDAAKNPGSIVSFDGRWNTAGHNSTDYDAWFAQDESTLEAITCVSSDKYEPYLVVRYCRDVPPFPEDFAGFGRNKIVWIQMLRRLGWQFLRAGGSFVTHLPHGKSRAFNAWNKMKVNNMHVPIDDVGESFRRWMIEQVPDQHTVPYCNTSAPAKHIWYPER